MLNDYMEVMGASEVLYDDKVGKVSIVGAGMETHAGVAAQMFEAPMKRRSTFR